MRCCRVVYACLALPAACSPPAPLAASNEAVVYVVQRDWHTDIGLPVNEIAGPMSILQKSFPGVRFLTFGFGERQFLINRSTNLIAMLDALLPSQSAILMTALTASPEQAFGSANVVTMRISRAAMQRVEAAIWQELQPSASGDPAVLADGPYPGSVFYAASSTYSALYTCNTWTADVLRVANLPVPATGVLFAGQVMGMARWIASRQSPQSDPVDGQTPATRNPSRFPSGATE
jgi:uncharacterized protein (TIGR02117 family)